MEYKFEYEEVRVLESINLLENESKSYLVTREWEKKGYVMLKKERHIIPGYYSDDKTFHFPQLLTILLFHM